MVVVIRKILRKANKQSKIFYVSSFQILKPKRNLKKIIRAVIPVAREEVCHFPVSVSKSSAIVLLQDCSFQSQFKLLKNSLVH